MRRGADKLGECPRIKTTPSLPGAPPSLGASGNHFCAPGGPLAAAGEGCRGIAEVKSDDHHLGQEWLHHYPGHVGAHRCVVGAEFVALHDALAIQKAIPDARHICVDLQTIRWTRKGLRYVFLTPHVAQDNIIAFDQGERAAIKPFTLRTRPAHIAKAGKRRRETPSDGELRGTGLTVNPVQLHISEATPQRFAEKGERNLDPDRIDGPPPAPKQTRVARRKVSTAAKGSVPTTLGGKLPPVSILSRREFGLRVMRK